MTVITPDQLLVRMKNDAQSKGICGVIMLLFLLGIAAIAGVAFFSVLALVPILMFGVPGAVMLLRSLRQSKQAAAGSLYVITDTCQGKKVISGGDTDDSYALIFSGNVKHTISVEDLSLMGLPLDYDDWLYNITELGDAFYLVYPANGKKPLFALRQKQCSLNMADFTEENGRLIPRKS